MSKLKTKSGAKKRFKIAGSRKSRHLRRRQANKNHILTKKKRDRLRRLKGLTAVNGKDKRSILRQLAEA